MSTYKLRFWFEHGGFCLWGMNEHAKAKYGYAIKNENLPIPYNLVVELNILEKEYSTYLNWDSPADPSPWTNEQKSNFANKANIAYEELKKELGLEYEIENQIDQCVDIGEDNQSYTK